MISFAHTSTLSMCFDCTLTNVMGFY